MARTTAAMSRYLLSAPAPNQQGTCREGGGRGSQGAGTGRRNLHAAVSDLAEPGTLRSHSPQPPTRVGQEQLWGSLTPSQAGRAVLAAVDRSHSVRLLPHWLHCQPRDSSYVLPHPTMIWGGGAFAASLFSKSSIYPGTGSYLQRSL